jgi:hypothetical protein
MYFRLFAALFAGVVLIGPAAAAQAQALRVALAPFQVNSSLTETEYLSSGLSDMIVARLEQGGQIAIVRLGEGVSDRKAAIEAGKQVGAEHVLFGSYTQFGEGASLDLNSVSVRETDEDAPRRVFIQAGDLSAIIPQLDDFSERISRHLVGASVAAAPTEVVSEAPVSGAPSSAILDLEQRVEALEQMIQSGHH